MVDKIANHSCAVAWLLPGREQNVGSIAFAVARMINKSWYLRDQGALVRMKGNSGGTYGTTRHFPLRYVARLRPQPPPLPSEPAGNGPVGEPVRFVKF